MGGRELGSGDGDRRSGAGEQRRARELGRVWPASGLIRRWQGSDSAIHATQYELRNTFHVSLITLSTPPSPRMPYAAAINSTGWIEGRPVARVICQRQVSLSHTATG